VTVFEFACRDCGPFEVIPVEAIRRGTIKEHPLRCPDCNGPESVDVLTDFDPTDAAWFSA
jgi:hypothetical protein